MGHRLNPPRRFDVSYAMPFAPERVWAYVDWAGVERLAGSGAFAGVTFGSREPLPGAVRYTHLRGGGSIVERLDRYDASGFEYQYTIDDGPHLPVRGYRGLVEVQARADGCVLRLAHDANLVDVAPETWRHMWLAIEEAVHGYIAAELAAGR